MRSDDRAAPLKKRKNGEREKAGETAGFELAAAFFLCNPSQPKLTRSGDFDIQDVALFISHNEEQS
jgi:hypothetical protein